MCSTSIVKSSCCFLLSINLRFKNLKRSELSPFVFTTSLVLLATALSVRSLRKEIFISLKFTGV